MTRPTLATFSGWFDGRIGADIHTQLSEFNPVKISSPLTNGGWPNWRWVERYIDKQAPDGPYVALGFSWGATAAARLAERDRRCVGLIYISGLEWRPNARIGWVVEHAGIRVSQMKGIEPGPHRDWAGFPTLFMSTEGELEKLRRGTLSTWENLIRAGAETDHSLAPNPGTHRKPHLAGVAHHLPAIRAFMDKHFGATE